jgi:hypothetical protein
MDTAEDEPEAAQPQVTNGDGDLNGSEAAAGEGAAVNGALPSASATRTWRVDIELDTAQAVSPAAGGRPALVPTGTVEPPAALPEAAQLPELLQRAIRMFCGGRESSVQLTHQPCISEMTLGVVMNVRAVITSCCRLVWGTSLFFPGGRHARPGPCRPMIPLWGGPNRTQIEPATRHRIEPGNPPSNQTPAPPRPAHLPARPANRCSPSPRPTRAPPSLSPAPARLVLLQARQPAAQGRTLVPACAPQMGRSLGRFHLYDVGAMAERVGSWLTRRPIRAALCVKHCSAQTAATPRVGAA